MAAKKCRRLPTSRKRIKGELSLRGLNYPFDIRKQIVNLGSAGRISIAICSCPTFAGTTRAGTK